MSFWVGAFEGSQDCGEESLMATNNWTHPAMHAHARIPQRDPPEFDMVRGHDVEFMPYTY